MIEYDLINLNEIPRVIWRWAVGAWLAQSVERWTFNPTVAGSSPASGLTFFISKFCGPFSGQVLDVIY